VLVGGGVLGLADVRCSACIGGAGDTAGTALATGAADAGAATEEAGAVSPFGFAWSGFAWSGFASSALTAVVKRTVIDA